jgi:prophage regulatory protein
MTKLVYRRPEVEALTGLSRSSIYAGMAQGTFPQAIKLGQRAVGWRASDLAEWFDNCKPRNEV